MHSSVIAQPVNSSARQCELAAQTICEALNRL